MLKAFGLFVAAVDTRATRRDRSAEDLDPGSAAVSVAIHATGGGTGAHFTKLFEVFKVVPVRQIIMITNVFTRHTRPTLRKREQC